MNHLKPMFSIFFVALTVIGVLTFLVWSPNQSDAQLGNRQVNQPQQRNQQAAQVNTVSWQYARLVVNDQQVTWLIGDVNFVPRAQTIARTNQQLGGRQPRANLSSLLDTIGGQGWELIDVNGSTWVFKRQRVAASR